MQIEKSIISGNTANYGGGIALGSGINLLKIFGVPVVGNTATLGGGGLYFAPGASVSLTGFNVSGNTAPKGGKLKCFPQSHILNIFRGRILGFKLCWYREYSVS